MEGKTTDVSTAEKTSFAMGDRVDQMCIKCGEERGHIVASISKKGRVTRVSCPICGSRVPYKSGIARTRTPKTGAPYDQTHTYRRGQTMMHPIFGEGEVTALIEPQKIDVLFADRMRRLIHSHTQVEIA
jgi:DNA-directed RNA polymerase subunit RPC12/RpoP